MRVLGIESGFPAVALIAYTLYIFPVSVLATAVALALRQWAAAALAGLAVIALAAVLAPRATGGPDSMQGRDIRVMAANVFHGNADPAELVHLARDRGVEFLCVEELTPGFASSLDGAGAAGLFPHRLLHSQTGVSGSGIYSRYPLRLVPLADVTTNTGASVRLGPGAELRVAAIHNQPLPTSDANTRSWADSLEALPTPSASGPAQILAGDFNATLDQSEFRELLDRGYFDAAERMGLGLRPTWPVRRRPTRFLPVTLDHVLYDRDRIGVRDFQVLDLPGSDHRTIYADLVLSG